MDFVLQKHDIYHNSKVHTKIKIHKPDSIPTGTYIRIANNYCGRDDGYKYGIILGKDIEKEEKYYILFNGDLSWGEVDKIFLEIVKMPDVPKKFYFPIDDEKPDFTIKIENEEFKCHKFVLQHRSQFFKALFNGNWTLSDEHCCLEKIGTECFQLILEFIYTSSIKMSVSIDTILEILESTRFLGIEGIEEYMDSILNQRLISDEELAKYLNAIDKFNLPQFSGKLIYHLKKNRQNVSKESFKHIQETYPAIFFELFMSVVK